MITKLFKDLSPGQSYAVRVRAVRADGQASDWSQILRFDTIGDQIAPAPITSLNWSATGTSFVAKWTAPTTNANGTALKDLKDYRVIISRGGTNRTFFASTNSFEFTQSMNFDLFGEIAYTLDIAISARDSSGNYSDPVTATAVQDTPPVPSTPILGNLNGLISVKWDGNPASGVRNPISVEHVEIHASTTSNFTPTESTEVGRFNGVFPTPQMMTIQGYAYDVPVFVRFVAVNRTGRKSAPSAQASRTPTRISGLDIANNQISVSQINFTARDIGGANAYYPATIAARDALTGVKNGDIAYITGSGYATYRYNGTTWVAASEIGVIAGTKILAGTLTADAVGTNLLITTSTNIGTAVIDSANIASVNAGTITVGTLQSSATVTYGGGSARPTWSFNTSGDGELNNINVRGQLVIGNATDTSAVRAASIVRSYDYIANTAGWAIKGDGTVEFNNGTFRGSIVGATITGGSITGTTITTAATGRRLELLTGTGSGRINFVAADGTLANIRAFSSDADPAGQSETIIMSSPVTGAWSGWNGIQVQGNESIYAQTNFVKFSVGAAGFSVAYASNKGTSSPSAFPTVQDRLYIASTQITLSNAPIYMVDNVDIAFYPHGPINGSESGHVRIIRTDPGHGSTSSSALMKFLSPPRAADGLLYGAALKMNYNATSATSLRLEVRNVVDDGYEEIWATGFIVSSDQRFKKNIRSLNTDNSLDIINNMKPKRFKRKRGDAIKPRMETGLLAQDMPEDLVIDGGEESGLAIDHFALTTQHIAATQKLYAMIQQLQEEIKELKK